MTPHFKLGYISAVLHKHTHTLTCWHTLQRCVCRDFVVKATSKHKKTLRLQTAVLIKIDACLFHQTSLRWTTEKRSVLQYRSCSSHQGSRVKLQNDMLHEDQQVGRPILQLVDTVEVFGLLIPHLRERGRQVKSERETRATKLRGDDKITFSCHSLHSDHSRNPHPQPRLCSWLG